MLSAIISLKRKEKMALNGLFLASLAHSPGKLESEGDEYLFLTEYKYQLLFGFQKSQNTEYWILFGIEKIQIPNTIRYQENPNTEYE